jgi:hypothetical protein
MDGNNNVFLQSLQQLGQYLAQQNQGTGSGLNLASGQGQPAGAGGQPFNLASGQQPSKIVTQVHFPTPESSTSVGQPAVATPPPAPQVSTFTPPQGGAETIPQPQGVSVPPAQPNYSAGQRAAQPGQANFNANAAGGNMVGPPGPGQGQDWGVGAGAARPATGPGSGQPTSNAISGITSALSKGLTDAASAIGGVRTMPTPIQSGPFPSINQYAPTLIGRRTQPVY